MNRMSARYIAPRLGITTSGLYRVWEEMGLVTKDKFGDWIVTGLGRESGGRMSKGSRLSVPTFELEVITKMVKEYLDNR